MRAEMAVPLRLGPPGAAAGEPATLARPGGRREHRGGRQRPRRRIREESGEKMPLRRTTRFYESGLPGSGPRQRPTVWSGQSPHIARVRRLIEKAARNRLPGAAAGRERHGQRGGGARHLQRQPARPVRSHRLRLAGGHADGERAVRPRQRLLQRRGREQEGPGGTGRRRHGLLRRNRRPAARNAGQAAAPDAGARVPRRWARWSGARWTCGSSPPRIAT